MSARSIPALTGIRGLAAFVVMLDHLKVNTFYGIPSELPILRSGHYGVELFFILSGFILTYVHASEFAKPSVAAINSFFVLRFFRVYPLHFIVLMITLAYVLRNPDFADWYRGWEANAKGFSFWGFFQTLTLTNRIGLADYGVWNGPTWSLSSEVVGYAAFPFVVYFLMGTRSKTLCYAIAITLLAAFTATLMLRGHIGLLRMVFCFGAGVALGRAHQLESANPPWTAALTCISAAVAIVTLYFEALNPFSVFAFSGLIYGLALGPSLVDRLFSSAPMMFLGRISFSLYLTHFNLLAVVTWLLWTSHSAQEYPTFNLAWEIAICVVVATATFYLVERPSHMVGRRLSLAIVRKRLEAVAV